jgi:hypothetical protein
VNDIGTLASQSGKFQVLFKTTANSHYGEVASIKPLCPTRWTVRAKAVRHIANQYEAMLEALEEMAAGNSNAATRAAGLLTALQKGSTLLALLMIIDVIETLEQLNTALQARNTTVSGIIKAVQVVKEALEKKRTSEGFTDMYMTSERRREELDLDPIAAPRIRKPPKRFDEPAAAFVPDSVEQHFRLEYFKVLDTILSQLTYRMEQDGLQTYN